MSIQIDEYQVERKLGAGGLADVFAARDAEGREVAIKVLREPERGGAHVRRFLREGRLLKRLAHPALPRCFAVVEGERPYIVLELMKGETLSERIRRDGPMPAAQVIGVATSLLAALDFLHNHGVVHRDVKSGNVFLKDDGRVMLMDLGLAGDPVDPLTTTLGDVMGTYAYMAPEQIAGAEMDRRADLYSLGVSLFEALVGKRPFGAIGAAAMLQAQRMEGAAMVVDAVPEATPGRLVELLTRLMTWDPTGRPATAGVATAILTGRAGFQRELRDPPLLGRNAALGALEAVLDAGVCVQLVGEDGMGLGRMVRVAWTAASARGMEIYSLRCGRRAPGLLPLEQLREQTEATVGKVDPGDVALFEALHDLNMESGVLVMVEDLDQASEEALRSLRSLYEATKLPFFVTTGARVDFPGRALTLRPLRLSEVRKMVSGMLSDGAPPAGLAEEIFRLTGGVPAAVAAGVRDLHSRDLLHFEGIDDEGELTWSLNGPMDFRPGEVLKAFAESILETLGEDDRSLVDALSVIGEPVPLHLALKIAGLEPDSMAPLALQKRAILREKRKPDGDWLELRRPAMASLVVSNMSDESQRFLHARFAVVLAEMEPSAWRDQRLPVQQALGSSEEEAPRALVGLGTWLAKSGEYARCLDVLERASRHLHLDPLTATYGALARGTSLLGLARASEATDAFVACRRLAEEQGRTDLVAQALLEISETSRRYGHAGRSFQAAEEARSYLREGGELASRSRAEMLEAFSLLDRGNLAEAENRFLALVAVEGQLGPVSARIQLGLVLTQMELGHVDRAVVDLSDLQEDLRGEEVSLRLEVGYHLANALLQAGRPGRSQQIIRESEALLRENGLARLRMMTAVSQAGVDLACGRLDSAADLLRRARGLEHMPTVVRQDFWRIRGGARLRQGDRPAALAAHQRGAEEAERVEWTARKAFHDAMCAVFTGSGDELGKALGWLHEYGHRQLSARVLLAGARVGADPEVMAAAVGAARDSGNRFLQLRALHLAGGDVAQEEASELAKGLLEDLHNELRVGFLQTPEARWLGAAIL
jgi:tetratricopeptide (TPR) repeat protein